MTDFADLPLFVKPAKQQSKLLHQWEEVKRQHPDFLPELARIAREYKASGATSWNISGCFEVLRWETRHTTATTGDITGLRLNNNFQPFASRDLMQQYPDLAGFFRIRKQHPHAGNKQMH